MQTITLLLPFILICLFGFLSVKVKLLDKPLTDGLAKLCFNILLPLFLFLSTYLTNLDTNISLSWFLSFYIPVIVMFAFVFLTNRFVFKKSQTKATVRSLVANYSNTVIIAIPILATLLPIEVAGQGFVIIGLHSALLFTLTEVMLNGKGLKAVLTGLNNPIVLSIFSGLACNMVGLPIQDLIMEPLNMLSQSAVALALFGLGASMNYLPVRGNRTTSFYLSIHKLMFLPLLAYVLGLYLFELNSEQLLITVLLTASPTGAASFLIASQRNESQDVAATTVVLSTILCPLTYLVWLQILI